MSAIGRILLINPAITSRRRARFPLSIMALAGSLGSRFESELIDGNIDRDAVSTAVKAVTTKTFCAVGLTVMGGPQVQTAIDISRAIRRVRPELPIVWGGYFPTLYPEVALAADYVDFVVRGQGEATFAELAEQLVEAATDFSAIRGLGWREEGAVIQNPDRAFAPRTSPAPIPYDQLPDARSYLVETFLGRRTAAHQAALGCRFRCTFCGVAAMFKGAVALPPAERLDQEIAFLKRNLGADSIQFYDHNFFDREEDMVPLLEVLARHEMPWWCYARADALVNLSPSTWRLVRKSKLRMTYIGAESPNDALLKSIRKGTRSNQTLEVAELCRRHGVIPELSFMVAPPVDPEGETERTFDFIREVKRVNPMAEIIVYIYTPLPETSVPNYQRLNLEPLTDLQGNPVSFPTTPDEWTEQRWVDYSCHGDAPWLTEKLRKRIRDFVTVLNCRYPTVQDTQSPRWAKAALRGMASWRYALRRYDRPWELAASHRLIGIMDPKVTSI